MDNSTQALLERARDDERFADPATHQVIAELASAVESLIKERDRMAEALRRVKAVG